MTEAANARPPLDGMMRVVLFNTPIYTLAGAIICVCFFAMGQVNLPLLLRLFAGIAGVVALFQTLASLGAAAWVYDFSPLKDWTWLKDECQHPRRIVNVHSGYDETSGVLSRLFLGSEITVVDLYLALPKREPSIEKARKYYPPAAPPDCTTLSGWPVPAGSADLILIAFAAHELREPALRRELLAQAAATVAQNGRIILVEHMRDAANFVAFGPGFVHFYPPSEWRNCIASAGLKIFREFRITPFVGVFVLCRF